jgi:hypothetical protein
MDFKARRKLSENHGCSHCDLGDEMGAEIERLRAALTQIADDPNRDGQSRNIAGAALIGYRSNEQKGND